MKNKTKKEMHGISSGSIIGKNLLHADTSKHKEKNYIFLVHEKKKKRKKKMASHLSESKRPVHVFIFIVNTDFCGHISF